MEIIKLEIKLYMHKLFTILSFILCYMNIKGLGGFKRDK